MSVASDVLDVFGKALDVAGKVAGAVREWGDAFDNDAPPTPTQPAPVQPAPTVAQAQPSGGANGVPVWLIGAGLLLALRK